MNNRIKYVVATGLGMFILSLVGILIRNWLKTDQGKAE